MTRPTSAAIFPSTITLNNRALNVDNATPRRELQNAAGKASSISFAELMKGKEQALDPAKFEAHQNVKAHTVLRSSGNIVAIQWSDGGTDLRGATKSGFSIFSETDSADERVRKLLKHYGNSVSVERYNDRSDAPTRDSLEKLR